MNDQTAVRQGPWKLVLNGRLIEGAPAEDALHLSNLGEDMGERINLAQAEPERAAELKALAEVWRTALEARWQRDQSAGRQGLVTH